MSWSLQSRQSRIRILSCPISFKGLETPPYLLTRCRWRPAATFNVPNQVQSKSLPPLRPCNGWKVLHLRNTSGKDTFQQVGGTYQTHRNVSKHHIYCSPSHHCSTPVHRSAPVRLLPRVPPEQLASKSAVVSLAISHYVCPCERLQQKELQSDRMSRAKRPWQARKNIKIYIMIRRSFWHALAVKKTGCVFHSQLAAHELKDAYLRIKNFKIPWTTWKVCWWRPHAF